MLKNIPTTELESLLNSTQFIIDNIMRTAMCSTDEDFVKNKRLQKLTGYREKIIKEIESRLDEIFKKN